jgi:UDP-N-acetylglucosamine pyrophosphorylase
MVKPQTNKVVYLKSVLTNVENFVHHKKKNESMGALAAHQGKISIVEYFALQEDNFIFSYTGQVALSTHFVRQAASISLPYHWVRKKFLWKREKFLFDAFSIAVSIKALCYNRRACFAPVKELKNIGVVEALLQGD